MKKTILVILGIFIIILLFVVGLLYNYNKGIQQAKYFNEQYERYYQKEISGIDLVTVLNKVSDYNERNNITKDENDLYYIESEASILVQIEFLDQKGLAKVFRFEDILQHDIQTFRNLYKDIKFKCTKIEYHEENKQVKSLYFEQTILN